MNKIQQHIKNGVISELRVEGQSMYPTLYMNQVVSISPISRSLINGEIYIYNNRTKIIIHRLLKIDKNNCIFIGDNTSTIHQIQCDQILGKAVILENRYYKIAVILINRIFYNRKLKKIFFNILRIKLIRILFILTHRGKYERKI